MTTNIYSMYNLKFRITINDSLLEEDMIIKLLYPLIHKDIVFGELYHFSINSLKHIPQEYINEGLEYSDLKKYVKYTKDPKWRLPYVRADINSNEKILKFISRSAFIYINDENKKINLYVDEMQYIDGFSVLYELTTEIIKLIYIKYMESKGYILLHAACLEYNGKGILIVGDSGAGKTTLLLNLLDDDNSYCISNDSVFVKKTEKGIHAVNLPYFFNIRKNSMYLYKNLKVFSKLKCNNKYNNKYNNKITYYHIDVFGRNKEDTYINSIVFPLWNNSDMSFITKLKINEYKDIIEKNFKNTNDTCMELINLKPTNYENKKILVEELLNIEIKHRLKFGRNLYKFIKKEYRNYLGLINNNIEVIIDRPIGYINEFGTVYTVNYGYIPNVIGGDNEEQDAYIIDSSLNVPLSNYIGKLIAIVYRKDDNETKWIISNERLSETEIYERISFIEKYFDSEVILC